MFIILFILVLIGLLINRCQLIKYFISYEVILFIISILLINYSLRINEVVIIFYIMWNSILELILGLNSLFL